MDPIWTPHRFSGGALALDVANTVVMRGDPDRRFDRFEKPEMIRRFAAAAPLHCGEALPDAGLDATDAAARRDALIDLREAIDAMFRDRTSKDRTDARLLSALLGQCSRAIGAAGDTDLGASRTPLQFETAVALSALGLLDPARADRIRICDNCGWLFHDRSRNGSRRWCDMSVCGNRSKARRHYARRRDGKKDDIHV